MRATGSEWRGLVHRRREERSGERREGLTDVVADFAGEDEVVAMPSQREEEPRGSWVFLSSAGECSGDCDGGEEEDKREWCIGRYGGGQRTWKRKEGNNDAVVRRCSHAGAASVMHWIMRKKRGAADVVL
ncbi:hypothetical protein HAX54_009445 [Datura stramonium]|uniref:Uncharacterized protein n=1 Tax=Datura stramonium TaxID=4076 RepID=A0ABS8TGL9_DATST|nr:hypothetical protein [Datura stramonium]